MCIIVFKPKSAKMPSDETLKTCFENNPNGAGYMFRANKQIVIRKGFMTFESFLSSLKNTVPEKTDLCMHFRIATHGSISAKNTHPFPITSEKKDLHETTITVNRALCHNGILQGYGVPKSDISDSGFLAKMLYPASTPEHYKQILSRHNQTSKFVVMTGKYTILSGRFITVGKCEYSNDTYQPFEPIIYRAQKGGCINQYSPGCWGDLAEYDPHMMADMDLEDGWKKQIEHFEKRTEQKHLPGQRTLTIIPKEQPAVLLNESKNITQAKTAVQLIREKRQKEAFEDYLAGCY